MPEPSHTKPKPQRSKRGCLVCRARRVKCDEEKPECSRCVKYSATCVYPEKKPYDPEVIGRKLRRRHHPAESAEEGESPERTAHCAVEESAVAGSGRHDAGLSARLKHVGATAISSLAIPVYHGSGTAMTGWFLHPTAPPPFLRRVAADDEELNLLHHCLTYSLSILVIDEVSNPFKTEVAPLFLLPTENAIVTGHPLQAQTGLGRPPLQLSQELLYDPDATDQPSRCDPDVWDLFSSIFNEEPRIDMLMHTDVLDCTIASISSSTRHAAEPVNCVSACVKPSVSPSVLALKAAMLHLGASHLAYLHRLSSRPESSTSYQTQSDIYKERALSYMRQAVLRAEELQSDAFLAACTTMLSAGVLTISTTWRELFRMGCKAFEADGGSQQMVFVLNPARPASSARTHLMEFLTVYDIFAAWSTGAAPRILAGDTTWWTLLGMATPGSTTDSVQRFTGMHRQVLLLTAEVALAVSESFGRPTSDQSHRIPALRLLARLAQCRVNLESEALTVRVRQGSLLAWHACNIQVRKVLLCDSRDHQDVQDSASVIIEHCEIIGSSGKIEYLNWVLMTAASVLQTPDLRVRITRLLDSFVAQCAYDIDAMKAITSEMWKRMDLNGDDEAVSWREVMIEIGLPIIII